MANFKRIVEVYKIYDLFLEQSICEDASAIFVIDIGRFTRRFKIRFEANKLKINMTKQDLIDDFIKNHIELVNFICSLPEQKLIHAPIGKWSAGQQLQHIYLCLVPINKILRSKEIILQKFGKTNRPVLDNDQVIKNYKTALVRGGKAPERFVPETFDIDQKYSLSKSILDLLSSIRQNFNDYTETEIDELILPHPLLGKLIIREFFFLMTFHATHHLEQTKKNLE